MKLWVVEGWEPPVGWWPLGGTASPTRTVTWQHAREWREKYPEDRIRTVQYERVEPRRKGSR